MQLLGLFLILLLGYTVILFWYIQTKWKKVPCSIQIKTSSSYYYFFRIMITYALLSVRPSLL